MATLAEARQKITELYSRRQSRLEHPDGRTDNAGRWYPSDDEKCDCCDHVRSPSRAYPWSYMLHCRTRKHVQSLLRKRGEI